jgi:CRP-like cAMP-binding protein
MLAISSPLMRQLERYATLGAEDRLALDTAVSNIRRFGPHDTLAKQGSPIERIYAVLDGFACRYKLLPDGRRQITAFMLPGDICDIRTFSLAHLDQSIAALSPVEIALIDRDGAARLRSMPALSEALSRHSLVQQSIAREWLLNIGHRSSFERLSHLLCELFERLRAVGLTRDHACEVPLTQPEIADTLALSAVHVNRTLMELRRSGLVTFQSRQLVIHDYPALRRAAGFDGAYLRIATPDASLS